jgi:hypothetical protein
MSDITLEGIASLLHEELKPILETQAEHTKILARHTDTLVTIASDVKDLLDQKTVTDHRLERIEHWAQAVGQKVGVKLEL